jgi:endonuclease G, mitochondrial
MDDVGVAAVPLPRVEVAARGDGVHGPEEFGGREGFDPGFLGEGFPTPWPGLPADVLADLAVPSDERPEQPRELRYTHFGVRFSMRRRQPLMTAVNIDGACLVRVKRGGDRWFADGRLPPGSQLGQADYADPEIDRGHMVRRQDPNWDPSYPRTAVAERANLDTFHYTNAAPQHSAMNQGTELWLGLEDYVLEDVRTSGWRACVFTGPVVRDDDPELRPGLVLPRAFWKLVAMVDAERRGLHATAYLLSQEHLVEDLLARRHRPGGGVASLLGPYHAFQVAVADLAHATGYDLSAYVGGDPLAAARLVAPGTPAAIRLDRREDVRC